jgi:hypothetical protein
VGRYIYATRAALDGFVVEVVDRVEGEEEGLSLVLRPGGRGSLRR